MASYILEGNTENKHSILTTNRLQTINKREISLEQYLNVSNDINFNLLDIYSDDNKEIESKNKILCTKNKITKEDLKNKYIAQIQESIELLKEKINNPNYPFKEDIPKFKKMIIELRKDQYLIKNYFSSPIIFNKVILNKKQDINYYQQTGYMLNNKYNIINDSTFYFYKTEHIAALLQHYASLKYNSNQNVQSTIHWILIDFEVLIQNFINECNNDKYIDILKYKLYGYSNEDINNYLMNKYNENYSITHLSTIINSTLPKLLTDLYKKNTIEWLYTFKLKGKWKQCSKCKKIKLANTYNFHKNKKGKYGLHSFCKDCKKKLT